MSRIRWFVEQLLNHGMQGIYVPIDADPAEFKPPKNVQLIPGVADGALPIGFARELSNVRTDLDRFSRTESALLLYHGYWSTHARLQHLRPEMSVLNPSWREFADLDGLGKAQLVAVIRAGDSFKAFRR